MQQARLQDTGPPTYQQIQLSLPAQRSNLCLLQRLLRRLRLLAMTYFSFPPLFSSRESDSQFSAFSRQLSAMSTGRVLICVSCLSSLWQSV